MLFSDDPRYRQFLAIHAGIWGEVGVLEDAALLASLRRDRRKAGLPIDRWTPPKLSCRTRVAAPKRRAVPSGVRRGSSVLERSPA